MSSKNAYNISETKFISKILKQQKIITRYIINNPIDTNFFKPKKLVKKKKFLFVARNDYYAKGFDIICELKNRGYDIDVITNNNKISKTINKKKLPNLINRYQCLIFPSRFEACGLVPLECMSCGLPIVMYNTGVGCEIRKEIPAYIVNKNHPDEYEKKINKIFKNYNYYSKLSRQYVINNHNLFNYEKKFIKLIDYLIHV